MEAGGTEPGPRPGGPSRSLLAGGAGIALLAAAVIAILSTAALIGVGSLPGGGGDGGEGVAELADPPFVAPEAAALAAAPAAEAVAAAPDAPSAVALVAPSPSAGVPSAGPGGGAGAGSDPGPGPGEPGPSPSPPSFVPVDPGPPTPPEPDPAGGSEPGILSGTVSDLDHTATTAGLDLDLHELTVGLTEPLDRTVNGTVNTVGGLVGNERLGTQLSGTVNQVTGGLLGPGGLTERLLRPRR